MVSQLLPLLPINSNVESQLQAGNSRVSTVKDWRLAPGYLGQLGILFLMLTTANGGS
jgi:hypothetical protein